MKNYLKKHPWKVIEEGFHKEYNRITESICSIGNGFTGQRANFEEKYSGDSLRGSYLSGIYYTDKTRVGWWKIGYPEYFAKVLNAVNWIGINVWANGVELDLNKLEIMEFTRELDMKDGILSRSFQVKLPDGKVLKVHSRRFCSYQDKEAGIIEYILSSPDKGLQIKMEPFLDFDIRNEDANYDEDFWIGKGQQIDDNIGIVSAETKKTGFSVVAGMATQLEGIARSAYQKTINSPHTKYCSWTYEFELPENQPVGLIKYSIQTSDFHHGNRDLVKLTKDKLDALESKGIIQAMKEHIDAWKTKWEESDIEINGDVSAQQGIRFNIFQLNQTYTGDDPRLNIGPKGFTGEKYGGSTYWDTEAYCLPFYLGTARQEVARNLLIYRYRHLEKAIENAEKLGFTDGAALYPMVTMNGEECHNEWEITFEEIHRNGAIAYAIYDYINYTGDWKYLEEHGLEVLIGIARFWCQRINWSEQKQKFVMLGVTGPNEYENNVNNNWYTNFLAKWCMEYCLGAYKYISENHTGRLVEIRKKTGLVPDKEFAQWQRIIDQLYFPEDPDRGVFLQQDGFLDKVIEPASNIPKEQRPINQNWSWDRILRSCFIKQADVLQGLYFFEHDFDIETLKRNFDFYEPITVHESSLSPCIHSILAARLGRYEKCYEMYLRTSRLDLDDYNNDTDDGLHITSMAGTWMSFVKGIAGMQVVEGIIYLDPHIPEGWESYSCMIRFRSCQLKIRRSRDKLEIRHTGPEDLEIVISGERKEIQADGELTIAL